MKFYSNGDNGMLIIAIILLAFLTHGDPDVWDALRAHFMTLMPPQ